MKWNVFLRLSALTFLSATTLSAQDLDFDPLGREIPPEFLPKQIRIRLEWFELGHEEMIELLEADDEKPVLSSNAKPMRDRVKALVKDGKAKPLETTMVIARSGQRAKTESIHEFIYPTEYDPPTAATPSKNTSGTSTTEKKEDGKDETKTQSRTTSYAGSNAEMPTAAAFETRNLGVTVEVDPVLGADDKTIDLNLAPEIVYVVGEELYGEFRNGDSSVDLKMPSVYTMKLTTQVTVIAGEYHFLGLHTPVNMETKMPDFDRKVIVFLRGDIEYVGLALEDEIEENADDKEEAE